MRRPGGNRTSPKFLVQIAVPVRECAPSEVSNRRNSTALYGRKVKDRFTGGRISSHFEEGNWTMSNKRVPTQTSHRSSRTGQFVTERYANQHPSTTERERIKHPERR